MTKVYDKAYFDRWYRHRDTRVNEPEEIRRKVTMAVSTVEYFLRREIRSVLDIGCGEGAWRSHLKALRPRISYLGYDSSDYVVQRFGKTRNIRKAAFGDLPKLRLKSYDLVVCADVMHYVPDEELHKGIRAIADATDGMAYLEVLTKEDDIVGDLDAFFRRPAARYRKLFTTEKLTFVGPYCWLGPSFKGAVAELETGR
ncbi:MAG TPA: class I SAM-dependent methyltransferase [Thermoanaerobaculia bacterium]|nr:class I SAM-dependent methyltransferase [Thermoanaerobaculia bacterium]